MPGQFAPKLPFQCEREIAFNALLRRRSSFGGDCLDPTPRFQSHLDLRYVAHAIGVELGTGDIDAV
jgi:hypothetical protein